MKTYKKVAIGMDHSVASVIKFAPDSYEMKSVESQFVPNKKLEHLVKIEGQADSKKTNCYQTITKS